MRSFTCFLFAAFYFFAFNGFSQTPVITAEVDGYNVILAETGAYRNCGAFYVMEINLAEYQLDWYQVDTGDVALCYCTFDLAVTYGPLEPGDYSVNVYYTDAWSGDTIFEGTTAFSIGNSRQEITSGIISQYQSDCYTGITDLEIDNDAFIIYPQPVLEGAFVNIEAVEISGNAVLEIFSPGGNLIFTRNYPGARAIHDRWSKEELFPVSGLYIARLKTGDNVFEKKIIVL